MFPTSNVLQALKRDCLSSSFSAVARESILKGYGGNTITRMTISALTSLILFAGTSGAQNLQSNPAKGQTQPVADFTASFASDRLLVKFREGLTESSAENIARGLGAASTKQILQQGLFLVRLDRDKDIDAIKKAFEQNPAVEFVEPDYIVSADDQTPNDPEFSKQWGLHNTGQIVNGVAGTADADIDAPEAWDKTTGSSQVVIAVVDAGVAWDHPDLQTNIWQNAAESLDGVDNDGNGYIDDIRGWDFYDDDNNPYDFKGHGTHVAGIAAAVGNNGIGITGVNWRAKIMPLRFLGVTGSGFISDAVLAIDYAVRNGAKVINASYGTSQFGSSERLAIENAKNAGVLFVASAGNSGTNNESEHHYPSDYDLDNIISVAATTQTDALASFSNYGSISVDVGAPGVNIYSTLNITPNQLFFDNVEAGEANWDKQSPWDLTTSQSFSPTHSWTDSPSGNYGNSVSTSLTSKNAISLIGYQGAKLSFKLRMVSEYGYDFLWIEASSDKTSWTTLSQLSGSTAGLWLDWEEDLSDYDGGPVYVRFRLTSDSSVNFDGAYIDDVTITAFPPGPYTYTGTEYEFFDGTSMATPHVTGLAALILSGTPSLTYDQLRTTILTTVDPLASLAGRIATGGRINARTATLNPPDITESTEPDPLSVTLDYGDTATGTITIGNLGERNLDFSIFITYLPTSAPPVTTAVAEKHIVGQELIPFVPQNRKAPEGIEFLMEQAQSPTNVTQSIVEANIGKEDPRYPDGVAPVAKKQSEKVEVARIADPTLSPARVYWDYHHSSVHTNLGLIIAQLQLVGHIVSQFNVPITSDGLAGYDVLVLEPPNSLSLASSEIAAIQTFVNGSHGLFVIGEAEGFLGSTGASSLNTLLGFYGMTLSGSFNSGLDTPVTDFTAHPVTQNVGTAEFTYFADIAVTSPSVRLARTSAGIVVLAAYEGTGKIVLSSDTHPFTDANLFDFDDLTLSLNIFDWLSMGANVSWLTANPISGTVMSGTIANVNLRFDTLPVIPGQTYRANIIINSNDPDESTVTLPAQMTVNSEPYFVVLDPTSSQAEGYAKDVISHSLRIHNHGQNTDRYNLSATGNRWRTQTFDSTGTTEITTTPTVPSGGNLRILVKVTIDSLAAYGTRDTVGVIATSMGDPARSGSAELMTTSLGRRGTVPWSDAFAGATLDPARWTYNNGPAEVNALALNEPSPPNALNLDGTSDNRGDEVRTQAIDLSGESAILLRYYHQAGGGAEAPDSGDSLKVDYQDAAGSWLNLAGHNGTGVSASTFTLREITLPAGAYHANFRLRFRVATSSGAGMDDWFVDDVSLAFPSPISVSPANFDVFVAPGDSVNKTLTLANQGTPGSAQISYSISAFESSSGTIPLNAASAPYPAGFHTMGLGKDESDTRRGNAMVLGQGAPDAFGHVWIDSDDPNGPAYNWVEISTTGALITGLSDETNVGPFNIGFGFPFYGTNFTSFRLCSNGFISFTSTATDRLNDPLPNTGAPFNLIAPFWDDLVVDSPGAVYFRYDGQRLIVEYKDVRKYQTSSRFSFELFLYPDGDVVFQYQSMPSPSNEATVGIQNASGTDGLQIVFNTAYVHDNLAVLITTGPSWLSFNPVSGTLALGASQNVTLKFNARGLQAETVLRANITVNSNGIPSVVTIPAILRTKQRCTAPVHFTFTANTGNSYALVIDNATLDGVRLEPCDEIGLFTPAGLCVGAAAWNDTPPLGFSAWQDDPQTPAIDGYRTGEQMSFRVWDSGSNAEYQAVPAYTVGNGTFGFGALARLSLSAVTTVAQTVNLHQGWNWISFSVQPIQPRVDSVFANVTGLEILQNCAGKFYIPRVINQIGDVNVLETYVAYMNSNSAVTLRGLQLVASNPISLVAGWNCISYLPKTPLSPQTALSSIAANLNIVKDDSGHFYIPGLVDNIRLMRSGRGYKANLSTPDTLIYPSSSIPSAKADTRVLVVSSKPSTHFQHAQMTGESYGIVITSVKIDNQDAKPGDEVAVLAKGRCIVGAGVWNENGVLSLAAWQDDERTSEIDGYQAGEVISFRFWDHNTNTEVDLAPTFEIGDGTFGKDPYALVKLSAQSLPKIFALHDAYPNPFNPETTIEFDLPRASQVSIKVFDMMGREVRTLINETKPAGYQKVVWDGRDSQGKHVTSGIYLYRMKAANFAQTKRMLLLK